VECADLAPPQPERSREDELPPPPGGRVVARLAVEDSERGSVRVLEVEGEHERQGGEREPAGQRELQRDPPRVDLTQARRDAEGGAGEDHEAEEEFRPVRQLLNPGDLLVLTTDGFFEWANAKGEEFGVKRLEEAVRSSKERPPGEIISALYKAVIDFSGGTKQNDDLTAVVIKRK